MLTSLRLMCIELLHVLMVWEPFRTLQEPVRVSYSNTHAHACV